MLKRVTMAMLGASAVLTLALVAHGAGSVRALLHPFVLWTILPFGILLLAARAARTTAASIAVLLGSLLAAGFGSYVYYRTNTGPSDAQNALIFAVIPVYQLGLGLVLLAAIGIGRLFFKEIKEINQLEPPPSDGRTDARA